MAPILTLLAIFALVAATPFLLAWSVTKLTEREQPRNGRPNRAIALKVGLSFFLLYALLFVGLTFMSIGGHMAHADFHGARRVPLDPMLVTVDRILSAISVPIPSLVGILANYLEFRLSPLLLLSLYIANGILLSSAVAYAYVRFTRKKGKDASPS